MSDADVTIDADWLGHLSERLDMPPARPRIPLALAVAGAPPVVVGSLDADLALGLAGAGLALRDTGSAWQVEVPDVAAIDPALAQIARWLHRAGRTGAWRDELLDVCDAEGRVHGVIERAAVRALGIATRAVHLVVSDRAGAVWVQQCAPDKAVDPNLWDTTVGGLIAAGESVELACERETWEEAGLRPTQLGPIRPFGQVTVRRPVHEGYMVERLDLFEAVAEGGVVPVNQDGEVSGFACMTPAELVTRLQADEFTLEAALILVNWLRRRAAGGSPPSQSSKAT